MKTYLVANKLLEKMEPYLFFWDEWTANGNCNLKKNEIELLYNFQKNNYQIFADNDSDEYAEIEFYTPLMKKLEIGYQVFRAFVIVNFLDTTMFLAKRYPSGFDAFLTTPIEKLEISLELKDKLSNFQVYNLRQLFKVYSANEFNQEWMYYKIVEVQKVLKKQNKQLQNQYAHEIRA